MALDKADLVLHEGVVAGHPGSDSLAAGDGRILAHGSFADLKPLVGPRTHLIRLDGRTVAPGFIDCHLHFMEGAAVANGLSVVRCRTIGDLLADLRLGAGKTPPGNWLRAFGCDEAMMHERRGPTRAELDASVGRNPLRLRHQTLHASWLNSLLGEALVPDFAPVEAPIDQSLTLSRVAEFVTDPRSTFPAFDTTMSSDRNNFFVLDFVLFLEYIESMFYTVNVPRFT